MSRLKAQLPLVLAWTLLWSQALRLAPFQLDDAYITYRYAAHAAFAHSLSFNVGDAPVEGWSSPLWMFMLAVCAKGLGHAAIPHCAFVLGMFAASIALAQVWCLTESEPVRWARAAPVLWLAVTPALVRYAGTGLEHAWFLVCVLGVAGACADRVGVRKGIACAVLAPWVRPEGIWVIVATLAARAASPRALLSDRTTRALSLAALSSQLVLSMIRYRIYHDFVPNTYWAKPSDLTVGLHYLLDLLTTTWGAPIALAAALGAIVGNRSHRSFARSGVAWLAAAALEGGDWMPDGRLALPGLALSILAAHGCSELARSRLRQSLVPRHSGVDGLIAQGFGFVVPGRERRNTPRLSSLRTGATESKNKLATRQLRCGEVLVAALYALGLGTALVAANQSIRLDRANFRSLAHEARVLARWLIEAQARSVALVDIGAIGFMGEQRLLDLVGLTDRLIARSPGRHTQKQFDLAYIFEQRRPDAIVLRLWMRPSSAMLYGSAAIAPSIVGGVEARIAADPRLGRDYRLLFAQLPYQRVVPYYGRLVYTRNAFQPAVAPPERVVYVEELPVD